MSVNPFLIFENNRLIFNDALLLPKSGIWARLQWSNYLGGIQALTDMQTQSPFYADKFACGYHPDSPYLDASRIDTLTGGGDADALHIHGTGGSGEKVKVSAADTTTDYLESKIIEGTNIDIVKSDVDGNEILTISSTATAQERASFLPFDEAPDGNRTAFTLTAGSYESGGLELFVGGISYAPGGTSYYDFTETSPETGVITLNHAPPAGREIWAALGGGIDGGGGTWGSITGDLGDQTDLSALLPSSDEKAALAGTDGTPSATNKYVTDSDSRMAGFLTKISAQTISVKTTEVELTVDSSDYYMILIKAQITNGEGSLCGDITITINEDETNSHYKRMYAVTAYNGVWTTGNGQVDSRGMGQIQAGDTAFYDIMICPKPNGKVRIKADVHRSSGNYTEVVLNTIDYTEALAVPITSIKITATLADAIGVGSTIRCYGEAI